MDYNDRYRLEEMLGRGGAGVVYRAFDLSRQRPVAIKYLDTSATGPDQAVERLQREAALLSRLAHPNIVNFYELGQTADKPYLVLEYIDGCTLRVLLETQKKPLPLELTSHVIAGVLAALTAAHLANIIHRDLKPENIMLVGVDPTTDLAHLSPLPQIKVMDFGLAYLGDEVRITGENLVAGTPLYLAPEAAYGQPVDGRADLYAVGLIFYEMVAGRLPFQGSDPLVIISQHLHVAPISPRWYNTALPPALATLILKLLAKSPADRYQTAVAVRSDLEKIDYATPAWDPPTPATLLESINRGRLIGRRQELTTLQGEIDTALTGRGSLILLEGETGLGKSRLIREASVYARLKGFQVYTGHCYETDLPLPYQPFIELVRTYVKTNSIEHLPPGLTNDLVKLVPGLEVHLGVTPPPAEVSAAEARLRLFEAVTTLFTSGAAPSLLVLENLQWASPSDVALLQHVAQTGLPQQRLLIVGTIQGMPQQIPTKTFSKMKTHLKRIGLLTHVRLLPLPADKVRALLETWLEGEVAPEFCQAIFAASEGNPLFIEEILKTLVAEGRIYRDLPSGRWQGINLTKLEIPASLMEMLERRFEKLSQVQLELLSLAALLGRQFRLDCLLAATADVSEAEVLHTLDEAIAMQLIRRVKSDESDEPETETYIFEHTLLHQALYLGLPPGRRALKHLQIGQALEKLNESGSQPIARSEQLAYHFSLAGERGREKAISYSLLAIEEALQVYASEVAIKHYQLLLDLLVDNDMATRIWILEELGDLYFRGVRQIVDAVAAYEWAIRLCQATPNPDIPTLIRLYRKMGDIARYWPDPVKGLDKYLAEALRLLDQHVAHSENMERVRVLAARAFNLHAQATTPADLETALTLAQTSADLAGRLAAPHAESAALDAMQRIYRSQGNLKAAHALDRRRLALVPRLTDPTEVVDAQLGAVQMSWEKGDLATAISYGQAALNKAKQTDNVGGQWETLRRLVILHLQVGKLAEATKFAEQGLALGSRAGFLEFGEPVEALFHTHLALVYTLQGEVEAAARELAQLRLLYPIAESPPHHFAQGWLHYETEAWSEARHHLERSHSFPFAFWPGRFDHLLLLEVYGHQGDAAALNQLNLAEHSPTPYLTAILQRGYGALYTTQAKWAEAEAAFKQALAATQRQGFWYQDARTWLDYGRMLAQRNQPGDRETALEFFNEAQYLFLSFGAKTLAEKAWIEATRLA